MKMVQRHVIGALAVAFMASGFAIAQERHIHTKKGHEHDTIMKQEKKITEAISALTTENQKLAKAQRFCPIMTYDRLGSMGTPVRVIIKGKPVFVCCKACKEDAVKGGEKTVKAVVKLRDATKELAKLPMNERMAIEAQKYCAIANTNLLGAMGKPFKLEIKGKSVYLCCGGCSTKAIADPAGTLTKAEKLIKAGTVEGHDHKHAGHKH